LSAALFALGLIVIAISIMEAVWTTLWIDRGSGPITSWIMELIWRGFKRISGKNHYMLSLAGPLGLTATVSVWVILLWAGWSVLFAADESAILSDRDLTPASFVSRVYYAAFTIFTLGIGNFIPQDGFWQIVTSLCTATGLLIVYLATTYLISVIVASSNKRAFADQVIGFRSCAEDFVLAKWDGDGFNTIAFQLSALVTQINTITEQHVAYPILHYYHAGDNNKASAIAIVILDEALTIFEFGIQKPFRPPRSILHSVREGVESYLDVVESAYVKPPDQPPPPPNLSPLREAGIPVVEDKEFIEVVNKLAEHRKLLLRLIIDDARDWPQVRC